MRIRIVAALVAATAALAPWPGSATASAEAACAGLGGTVGAGGICNVHTENQTYTLDFTFPDDYPDQQAVLSYLTQTRDGFVNVSEMPGSWNLPYALDAKGTAYSSGVAPEGTRSLVFEVYQNVGGAHPQTWFDAFNYDLGTNTTLTYDNLFKPGANPLGVIYPIVVSELQRQTGVDGVVLPEAETDPSRYHKFAITDDAVIFFFGQGEVMAGAAGAAQVSVPRATLAPMLAI